MYLKISTSSIDKMLRLAYDSSKNIQLISGFRLLIIIVVGLFFSLSNNSMSAQDLKFNHITTADGLSHSNVICIYQDR